MQIDFLKMLAMQGYMKCVVKFLATPNSPNPQFHSPQTIKNGNF